MTFCPSSTTIRFVTVPGLQVPKWNTQGEVLDARVNPSHLLSTASFSQCYRVLRTCGLDQAYGRVFIFLIGIECDLLVIAREYLGFPPLKTSIVIPLALFTFLLWRDVLVLLYGFQECYDIGLFSPCSGQADRQSFFYEFYPIAPYKHDNFFLYTMIG